MYKYKYISVLILIFSILMNVTACSNTFSRPASMSKINAEINSVSLLQGDPTVIWHKLQQTPSNQLAQMLKEQQDSSDKGWVELALINKQFNNSAHHQQLSQQLIAWQNKYPAHPANTLLPATSTLEDLTKTKSPKQIAVLLPQRGVYAASSNKIREGILKAYYANLQKIGQQNIKFYDTTQTQNLPELYQKAIADGADTIIGPLSKKDVMQLQRNASIKVPTIALNYSEKPSLPDNFYEFGLSPEDEANNAAERAYNQGLTQAIVIAPDNAWGKRIVQSFTQTWTALGGKIQDNWYFQPKTNFNTAIAHLLNIDLTIDKQLMQEDNKKEILSQQRRHDFDVIFLFSQAKDARVIVPLLRFYYVNDIPIFATSTVYSGKLNVANDNDLNGVTVCDIPWKKNNNGNQISAKRLKAVGQDAYLLSQSVSELQTLSNFPIYGKSGALALSRNQQIYRRLPCRTIHNGLL